MVGNSASDWWKQRPIFSLETSSNVFVIARHCIIRFQWLKTFSFTALQKNQEHKKSIDSSKRKRRVFCIQPNQAKPKENHTIKPNILSINLLPLSLSQSVINEYKQPNCYLFSISLSLTHTHSWCTILDVCLLYMSMYLIFYIGCSPKKLFSCQLCGKVLCSKASLKRHIADKHAERQEEYRCIICERVYCSRNSLMTHIYTYHKSRPGDHQLEMKDIKFF